VERIQDPDDCHSEDDDPILSKDDTISDASNPDEPSLIRVSYISTKRLPLTSTNKMIKELPLD
jgi:hypothetical protein